MPGKAAKVWITEKQQVLLEEFARSRTAARCVSQRAAMILAAFAGRANEDIGPEVGLNRQQVGLWRRRWRDAWDALCLWECAEPRRLREAVLEVLADAPRPGTRPTFTSAQVVQILAVACEPPSLSGRPITCWTHRELRDEVVKRGLVPTISKSHVGHLLLTAALKPHRRKMWLNTTEKDPVKFRQQVEKVCQTDLDAPGQATTKGVRTISVDEATGIQALERTAPDKPPRANRPVKQEDEYERHGTTTLTVGLNIVTGAIVSPTLSPTRTEPEFVQHIADTVKPDPEATYVFVVDNLNTHVSASLVQWVAEQCDVTDDLGKKGFAAC